jgi:hypothetical protein
MLGAYIHPFIRPPTHIYLPTTQSNPTKNKTKTKKNQPFKPNNNMTTNTPTPTRYGAKLANIFSTRFTIETADRASGKKYRQTFRDNMTVRPSVLLGLFLLSSFFFLSCQCVGVGVSVGVGALVSVGLCGGVWGCVGDAHL